MFKWRCRVPHENYKNMKNKTTSNLLFEEQGEKRSIRGRGPSNPLFRFFDDMFETTHINNPA